VKGQSASGSDAREGGGVAALASQPPPGMTPRLSTEQRAQVPTLLARGAPAYGFTGDVWTAKRVAQVIERTFGVRYHPDHVSRLLRSCGWSYQRPITQATQRDAAKIAAWHEQRWPAVKKGRTNREQPSSG
jgi:transposase